MDRGESDDIAEGHAIAAIDDENAPDQPNERRCHREKCLDDDEEASTSHVLSNRDAGQFGVGVLEFSQLFRFSAEGLGYDHS